MNNREDTLLVYLHVEDGRMSLTSLHLLSLYSTIQQASMKHVGVSQTQQNLILLSHSEKKMLEVPHDELLLLSDKVR